MSWSSLTIRTTNWTKMGPQGPAQRECFQGVAKKFANQPQQPDYYQLSLDILVTELTGSTNPHETKVLSVILECTASAYQMQLQFQSCDQLLMFY